MYRGQVMLFWASWILRIFLGSAAIINVLHSHYGLTIHLPVSLILGVYNFITDLPNWILGIISDLIKLIFSIGIPLTRPWMDVWVAILVYVSILAMDCGVVTSNGTTRAHDTGKCWRCRYAIGFLAFILAYLVALRASYLINLVNADQILLTTFLAVLFVRLMIPFQVALDMRAKNSASPIHGYKSFSRNLLRRLFDIWRFVVLSIILFGFIFLPVAFPMLDQPRYQMLCFILLFLLLGLTHVWMNGGLNGLQSPRNTWTGNFSAAVLLFTTVVVVCILIAINLMIKSPIGY